MNKELPTRSVRPNEGPRIGYVLRMYPRFSQTFVVNEILALEELGTDISICSLRKPDEGVFHESISRVNAQASYIPEVFLGHSGKHFKSQWRMLRSAKSKYLTSVNSVIKHRDAKWFDLLQAAHLLRWANKRKIGHVHVHFGTNEATVAMLAHKLGGLSYSLTLHAFDIFRDNVDRALLAEKINSSRFTVTVCESNRRFMLKELPGVNAARIRVHYNGIDLARFAQGNAERDNMLVFAVGRLIEKKGFIHLIRAIAILRDSGLPVRCEIAGEGREHDTLKREVKSRGIGKAVKFLGPVRQDEVRLRLQKAGCFALPCVQAKDGNVDALPTVLLESLASGCPSISTRLSGIPEIIEDGVSGLLVSPNSSEELAVAIRKVVENPTLAEDLARGGLKKTATLFDATQNAATLRRWFVEATEGVTTAHRDKLKFSGAKLDGNPTKVCEVA